MLSKHTSKLFSCSVLQWNHRTVCHYHNYARRSQVSTFIWPWISCRTGKQSWMKKPVHKMLTGSIKTTTPNQPSQAWELRMEKSAEKWGSGGCRRPLVGVRGRSWSFLTKIRRKNCIKQPCIFQFLTWCKTITFWFERTVLCFGADTFLFQRKSAADSHACFFRVLVFSLAVYHLRTTQSASQGWPNSDNCMSCYTEIQMVSKLAISHSHMTLTLHQPPLALTVSCACHLAEQPPQQWYEGSEFSLA